MRRGGLDLPNDDRGNASSGRGSNQINVETSCRDWRRDLFNYFRRCGVPAHASDDLTQETFLALLDSLSRFDPNRGPLRSFLFGIAKSVRKAWERRSGCSTKRHGEIPACASGPGSVPEDVVSVRSAVLGLPDEQREAILLREFHGFSYEEIAGLQGVPVGTVRSRLARAREDLRDRLMQGRRVRPGRTK